MTGPEILGLLALGALMGSWFYSDVQNYGWTDALLDLSMGVILGLLAALALFLLIGYP